MPGEGGVQSSLFLLPSSEWAAMSVKAGDTGECGPAKEPHTQSPAGTDLRAVRRLKSGSPSPRKAPNIDSWTIHPSPIRSNRPEQKTAPSFLPAAERLLVLKRYRRCLHFLPALPSRPRRLRHLTDVLTAPSPQKSKINHRQSSIVNLPPVPISWDTRYQLLTPENHP